jgi:hypothetical protein
MPGNKAYVLREAQREVERLRQEIERLNLENKGLRADTKEIKEQKGSEPAQGPREASSERDAASPGAGEYFVVTGVIKILAHA